MCRRIDAMLIICLCSLCLAAPVRGFDEIAQFLERHGLHELLTVHLEDRIEAAAGAERDELVLRLASLYATLLEKERSEATRARLEERSRRLLSRAPSNSADELRLALLRGSYLRTERIAEQHRVRLAGEEDVGRALSTLNETISELQRLMSHYDSAAGQMNLRLSRASGIEASTLYAQLDRIERMRGSCRFLLAWSLYYRAWLGGESTTQAAERHFADLLLADVARPQPADIARDLRAFEPMARSIVGMALCKSISGTGSATALNWIDLLDDPLTFEPVRREAPGWRLVIHLEHGEYQEAHALLEAQREGRKGQGIHAMWLRLAAVGALEPSRNEAAALGLVQFAITQLAAAGELQQILDLAERYGTQRLGTSGFAIRYVNGLILYRRARDIEAGASEAAARPDDASALYAKAIAELEAALRSGDAAGHPEAAAACRRLLAWALYFSGEYLRAREAFELAAKESSADEAAESLWMAIVCLDRLVQAGPSRHLRAEREALVDRFLTEYPASPRAATLLVNRAARAESLSDEEISRLLAIGPQHESYFAARRQASQAMYARFREASGKARRGAGEAFLAVATPLLDARGAFGDPGDEAARARRLVHVRRVMEVALHEDIADVQAARRALALLADFEQRDPDLAARHRSELDYRRLQERLLSSDAGAASSLAESLRIRDDAGVWARLGARAMFHHAQRKLRGGDDDAETLRMIVRHGGHVLRELDADLAGEAIRQGQALSYYAATAEASFTLWRLHGEAEEGPRALFVYRLLLTHHPRQLAFLRPAAMLAEDAAIADHEFAAECWRRLSAGAAAGSSAWFEARLGLMNALMRINPERAREVMNQHRQLHPEYGPTPWGERLRALDERMTASEGAG